MMAELFDCKEKLGWFKVSAQKERKKKRLSTDTYLIPMWAFWRSEGLRSVVKFAPAVTVKVPLGVVNMTCRGNLTVVLLGRTSGMTLAFLRAWVTTVIFSSCARATKGSKARVKAASLVNISFFSPLFFFIDCAGGDKVKANVNFLHFSVLIWLRIRNIGWECGLFFPTLLRHASVFVGLSYV